MMQVVVADTIGSSLVVFLIRNSKSKGVGRSPDLKVALLDNRKLHILELKGDCLQRVLVPSTNLSRVLKNCKGMLVAVLPTEKLKDNSTSVLRAASLKKWHLGIVLKLTMEYTIVNKCVFSNDGGIRIDRNSIPHRYTRNKASFQFLEFPSVDGNGYLKVNPSGPMPIVPPSSKAVRKQLSKAMTPKDGKWLINSRIMKYTFHVRCLI